MAITIKDCRDHLDMTQGEFAALIDQHQETISRWEKESPGSPDEEPKLKTLDDLPGSALKKIADRLYCTTDELLQFELSSPKALEFEDTWFEAKQLKERLLGCLEEKLEEKKDSWANYKKFPQILAGYEAIIKTNIRKARIAFIGQSGVGKSTLINALLGAKKMPTGLIPTTSITVYVKHIDDRPEYIKEEVRAFKATSTLTIGDSYSSRRFNIDCLEDKDKCEKFCVAKGGTEILKQYGTRQGYKNGDGVVAAVIFVDSPILHNVDLVDHPGFEASEAADEAATTKIGKYAVVDVYLPDAVVFMSRAKGFLSSGEEMARLRKAVQNLPCFEKKGANEIDLLGNLFIVASKASMVDGGSFKLREILEKKCLQFEQILPDDIDKFFPIEQILPDDIDKIDKFFQRRSKLSGYAREDYLRRLRERFFTYTADDKPDLRKNFEEKLCDLVKLLPKEITARATPRINEYARVQERQDIEADIEEFKRLLTDKERGKAEFERISAKESKRKAETQRKKESVIEEIKAYNEEMRNKFQKNFSEIINEDYIVDSIKARGFQNNKEDMVALLNYIFATITDWWQPLLIEYLKKVNISVDGFIKNFEHDCKFDEKSGIKAEIPFMADRAFVSGLAGADAFGGLAVWASNPSLGDLGANILATKGASILSELGLSVPDGSDAATNTLLGAAMYGRTFGFGMFALAAGIAPGGASIFSGIMEKEENKKAAQKLQKKLGLGGWEKKIATMLVEACKSEDVSNLVQKSYEKSFEELGGNTVEAFKAGADEMEKAWGNAIADREALIDKYDDDIKRKIEIAEELKEFLSTVETDVTV